MAAKHQLLKIKIPEKLKPRERADIADLVIERIVDRTLAGLDKNGKRFPGYSQEYIKSLDFRNAGKSKSKINLELSGDMLAALSLLSDKKGEITIGFERGSDENARADGNIRGTYGQDEPIRGKKRDFLGITQSELRNILDLINVD